jgi:hypothetical protein
MSQIASPPVQQAMERLKALSADQATREQAWNRERALYSENTEKWASREEGRIEGQARTLARQLTKRFGPLPDELRQRLDNATGEQLEHWTDTVLDAPTLSAVFAGH